MSIKGHSYRLLRCWLRIPHTPTVVKCANVQRHPHHANVPTPSSAQSLIFSKLPPGSPNQLWASFRDRMACADSRNPWSAVYLSGSSERTFCFFRFPCPGASSHAPRTDNGWGPDSPLFLTRIHSRLGAAGNHSISHVFPRHIQVILPNESRQFPPVNRGTPPQQIEVINLPNTQRSACPQNVYKPKTKPDSLFSSLIYHHYSHCRSQFFSTLFDRRPADPTNSIYPSSAYSTCRVARSNSACYQGECHEPRSFILAGVTLVLGTFGGFLSLGFL